MTKEKIDEASGERGNVVSISNVDVGHTTKSRRVILKVPGKGILAFPIETAEFIVSAFTEQIELLKRLQ